MPEILRLLWTIPVTMGGQGGRQTLEISQFTNLRNISKQDQINSANSAFILINCFISQGFQSGLIGPGVPGVPGGPGGPVGPGGPGVQDNQGGQDGQGGQIAFTPFPAKIYNIYKI